VREAPKVSGVLGAIEKLPAGSTTLP